MKGIGDVFDPGEWWFWLGLITLPIHGWITIPALLIWAIVDLID